MPELKKKSVVLLHGVFEDNIVEGFKKSDGGYFVMEGRPNLEASKASIASLLKKKNVPTVIADNMAGFLFYKDLVKEVRIAYQYIDEKGALCDIGSLILGVLAKKHGVEVHLYAGKVRRRFLAAQEDLRKFNGKKVAHDQTRVYGPLVEWLDRQYVTNIHD